MAYCRQYRDNPVDATERYYAALVWPTHLNIINRYFVNAFDVPSSSARGGGCVDMSVLDLHAPADRNNDGTIGIALDAKLFHDAIAALHFAQYLLLISSTAEPARCRNVRLPAINQPVYNLRRKSTICRDGRDITLAIISAIILSAPKLSYTAAKRHYSSA